MTDNYYVISVSEDGDIHIDRLLKADLLNRLNERYYGNSTVLTKSVIGLKNSRTSYDLMTKAGIIIIKGNIIYPKIKETVLFYDID